MSQKEFSSSYLLLLDKSRESKDLVNFFDYYEVSYSILKRKYFEEMKVFIPGVKMGVLGKNDLEFLKEHLRIEYALRGIEKKII